MLSQTFAVSDAPKILVLGFLEWVLSADNALAIALLVRHLNEDLQKKALFIGIASAFLLRALAITAASFLIHISWVEILGALYLIYLSLRFFVGKKETKEKSSSSISLWKTILLVELIDLVFAVDSILSAFAFIAPYELAGGTNPKLWILYIAAVLGIVSVRFTAEFFTKLLRSYPRLHTSAHLLIGWIGLSLFFDGLFKELGLSLKELSWVQPLFWSGIAALFLLGLTGKNKEASDGH